MIDKALLLKFGSIVLSFPHGTVWVISLILSICWPFQLIPATYISCVCMVLCWSICLISDCFFATMLMSGWYICALF